MRPAPHFKMNNSNKIIFISGPTGVGKSDFAEYLSDNLGCATALLNADMGQIYTPLSIGTAKPEDICKYDLFNLVDGPFNLSAHAFRELVVQKVCQYWAKGQIPIIVGGSGFYMKSLFYSLSCLGGGNDNDIDIVDLYKEYSTEDLYLKLKDIDLERAEQISSHDRYRIERALFLWKKTSTKPSAFKPKFEPLGTCYYYFLTREKHQLKSRIDQRIAKMLEIGWIDEVEKLSDAWKKFLLRKKLIGYPEIIEYLEAGKKDQNSLIETIGYKTAQYAKRQLTFWRSLKKQLVESDPDKCYIRDIQEFDLTNNFECLKDIIVKKIHES